MTAEHVAYLAAERPDAVAVISDGRPITYAALDRDIRAMERAMRTLGLVRGNSIAVSCGNLYAHWLLLLASERLGIAAASLLGGIGKEELIANVDLVLAESPLPIGVARRSHLATADWVGAALARPEADEDRPSALAPDDPVRLVSTSGTTGRSKRFLVSRRTHDIRVAQWISTFHITRSSRYLVSLPMVVRGAYDCGCACLRVGGTIVLETRMGVAEALHTHAISHILVLPIHLKTILEGLPANFAKPRDLTIVSFGGRISSELRERTAQRLTTALCETYGTAEVCTIATIWRADTDSFGTIPPGVEVEVLDEQGTPLPLGRVGQIRIRGEVMCAGYLDNPDATSRMFKDGWFHPGDLAILQRGRQLKILGRSDDLLNLGGQKYLPTFLENLLLRHAPAEDVGVCAVAHADGTDRLCISGDPVR
jgi:acyl-CoA synthetase (AMP-forming)/AMP-acid ligase II